MLNSTVSVGSLTVGGWSSSRRQPDEAFEAHRFEVGRQTSNCHAGVTIPEVPPGTAGINVDDVIPPSPGSVVLAKPGS